MDTTRQNKVSRLIQKDLSEFFRRESRTYFSGALITVTKVKVTKDVGIARIYLSFFATDDKLAVLKHIQEQTKHIRHQMATRIKSQIRFIPELEFYEDDSIEYLENIERLLKK